MRQTKVIKYLIIFLKWLPVLDTTVYMFAKEESLDEQPVNER